MIEKLYFWLGFSIGFALVTLAASILALLIARADRRKKDDEGGMGSL